MHGDDSQLVLFIDPDEESIVIIVEDAAAGGPITIQTGRFEELIAFSEQEVVIDELLLIPVSVYFLDTEGQLGI